MISLITPEIGLRAKLRMFLATAVGSSTWWTSLTPNQRREYREKLPESSLQSHTNTARQQAKLISEVSKNPTNRNLRRDLREITRKLHDEFDHTKTAPHLAKLSLADKKSLLRIENWLNGSRGIFGGRRAELMKMQLLAMRKRLPAEYVTPPHYAVFRSLTLKPSSVAPLISGKTLNLSRDRPLSHWTKSLSLVVGRELHGFLNNESVQIVLRKKVSSADTLLNCIPMSRDFNQENGTSLFQEVICRGDSKYLNRIDPNKDVVRIRMPPSVAIEFGLPVPTRKQNDLDYVHVNGKWQLKD